MKDRLNFGGNKSMSEGLSPLSQANHLVGGSGRIDIRVGDLTVEDVEGSEKLLN